MMNCDMGFEQKRDKLKKGVAKNFKIIVEKNAYKQWICISYFN